MLNENENQEEQLEIVDEIEEIKSEPEISEVEQEAKKTGHLTKEAYIAKHGSEEGYKSPEEFVKYGKAWGEVGDVIKGLKKKLDERDKQIESVISYQERVEERAKQRAKQELETQLIQARQQGDIQAVEELTKEKTRHDYVSARELETKALEEQKNALNSFQDRNKHWFNESHPEMVARATELDRQIRDVALRTGRHLSFEQLGHDIEAAMRIEFPDVAGAVERQRAPITSSRTGGATISADLDDDKIFKALSDEHKNVFRATKRMLEKKGYKASIKNFVNKLKAEGEL